MHVSWGLNGGVIGGDLHCDTDRSGKTAPNLESFHGCDAFRHRILPYGILVIGAAPRTATA